MEIVSPNFMNVRDHDPQTAFIPAEVRIKKDLPQDAVPVDVVFDKAEVAASKSSLTEEKEKEHDT